jgi:hypothetical protein
MRVRSLFIIAMLDLLVRSMGRGVFILRPRIGAVGS